jgi:hypothetical protein
LPGQEFDILPCSQSYHAKSISQSTHYFQSLLTYGTCGAKDSYLL